METVRLAYDVYETENTVAEKYPIILLHGLFWNKYMFKDLAKDLCTATRRKVFCVDLRCHDETPFREECDAFLMAEDLKVFVRERDLEKVVFVAHSFSSTVAYLFALDQPSNVEKIVMIDHAPFPDFNESFYKNLVLPQFLSQNRFLTSLDPSLSLLAAKKKILSLAKETSIGIGQKLFLEKIAYDLTKENNVFKWKTNHQFLIDIYHERALAPKARGSSDLPILIIRCEGSQRISDQKYEAVKQYNPNAKLITFSDTTHLLMFEKQEEFVAAVQDFLS